MVANWSLAARLAWRELRGGVRGLRIVLACLSLGVAAIAAVGTLRTGIELRLAQDGRRILGGDIEVLGGSQRLPDTLRRWFEARGARLSEVVTMRSMLVAPSGERTLVELKAVDAAWPLVGSASVSPPAALGALRGGILVDPAVLPRLRVTVGQTVRLGDSRLVIRGTLTGEPDRVTDPSIFGPRVLMSLADLPATGLTSTGSLNDHHLRAVLPRGASVAASIAALREAFPDTGWRIRDAHDAAPDVVRFIDQTGLFLNLVGLAALLVGGIGVAGGVRTWLLAHARTVAILRSLGADAALVFRVCMLQVMALAAAGVLAGVLAGAALPPLLAATLGAALPIVPAPGPFPVPLLLAAASGLLVAGTFALPALGRATKIPGAALFRDTVLPGPERSGPRILAATTVLGAALATLVIATSTNRAFAAGFCAAALASLGVFRLGGLLLMRAAAGLPPPRRFAPRLGVSGLHRPGAATPALLVSVGLGLSVLASVTLVQGNIHRQIAERLPARAPSFFFIDLQPDQLARFHAILAAIPGVDEVRTVPSLRARMVAVNGVPAEQVRASRDTAWALRGDRGLTYAGAMPRGTKLAAGQWWPADYGGAPLVSFDAYLARGWGVHVGDTLRVNVLGRDIDLRVANLRDIDWRSLGLNFSMVASPGLLSGAPHTEIATVRATPASQPVVLRRVTDALPNVTGIAVAEVLAAVARILGQLGAALTASGGITLLAGALVLAGAVASGQQRRIREAVILKVLGATRAQIRAAWLVEFGVLGAASGVLAGAVGTLASFAVARWVMHAPWWFLPGRLLETLLGCIVLMLLLGFAGTEAALRARPASFLRALQAE
jgi:putative ABC transport system permease protein